MKDFNLNHPYTPKVLEKINQQVRSLLESEELDDAQLRSLVEKRDLIICEHLEALNSADEKQFAKHELEVNQKLSDHISEHLKLSLNQLSGLLRGRKAVNKYK